MSAFTAWVIVTIGVFVLIAFLVVYTGSLVPLWLVLLPFSVSFKGETS